MATIGVELDERKGVPPMFHTLNVALVAVGFDEPDVKTRSASRPFPEITGTAIKEAG